MVARNVSVVRGDVAATVDLGVREVVGQIAKVVV
jgi:hypothetical protein